MTAPEWLIENGIGERRLALVDGGKIIEARIVVDGIVPAGSIIAARLTDTGKVGRKAIASADGQEYLLSGPAPAGTPEGAILDVEITREVIPGGEPWKRPHARVVKWGCQGFSVLPEARQLVFPGAHDELEEAGWSDLLEEARSGLVCFKGGELRISPTPAMTLIDVDGYLAPLELAIAGAGAAARTIRRHAIGGSIGIDFPTVEGKAERQEIAEAIDAILPQPFERTAVNGFGFLQIIRPRHHASLFEIAADRAAFEARALLRRAARVHGPISLTAHPAVVAVLEKKPKWLEAVARQVGGAVGLRAEPSLTMSGGHVEKA